MAFEELEAIELAKYKKNVLEVQTLHGRYFQIAKYLTNSAGTVLIEESGR